MIRRHRELALVIAPRIARPVRVHLDAKPVRIGEVDRFTHEMIGHSRICANLGEMSDEASEECTIGEQNGEVIQAEQPALGHRSRALQLAEVHDLPIVSMWAEAHRIGAAT